MNDVKKMIYQIIPPCGSCPYKLGIITTVVNPCPQCKLSGYKSFEQYKKQISKRG